MTTVHILLAVFIVLLGNGAATKGQENPMTSTSNVHLELITPTVKLSQPQARLSQSQARLSQPQAQLSQPQARLSQPQARLSQPQARLSQTQAEPMVDRKSPLLAALVPTSTDDRTSTVTTAASNRDLNLTKDSKSQTPILEPHPPSPLLKEKRAKKGRWSISLGDVVNGVRQDDENQGSIPGVKDREGDAQSGGSSSSKKVSGSKDVAESDALADIASVVDNLSLAQMKLILDQLNPQQTNPEEHGSLGVGMMCCLVG